MPADRSLNTKDCNCIAVRSAARHITQLYNQFLAPAGVASGWHTAALTMRLLVDSEFRPAGGILGIGFDALSWLRPVRPGDELHVSREVLEVRPSKSRSDRGMVRVRNTTLNQNDEAVQILTANLIVPRRPGNAEL